MSPQYLEVTKPLKDDPSIYSPSTILESYMKPMENHEIKNTWSLE